MTVNTVRPVIAALALSLAVPAFAATQQPVTKSQTTRAVATITAIDSTSRLITLKTDKGEEDSFRAGPDMARFNELKVGDKVNVAFTESIVFAVRKPGDTSATATTGDAAVTRGTGARPGGTIAGQIKTTVTVKAIDTKAPSITVQTEDGRTVTRLVQDAKNLQGIKVGDKADITYTQAVLVSVESAR